MAYQSYTYDRVAMISDYELLLRQQAEYIPPFTDKELQRPALICHYNRAAVAEALEGIKSMRFEMFCDHIASRGIPISENDSNTAITFILATSIGVAVEFGIRALYTRLRKEVLLNVL